jgi:hypothetical protein
MIANGPGAFSVGPGPAAADQSHCGGQPRLVRFVSIRQPRCVKLIKAIKGSKNVNYFTKSLATQFGVANNVVTRSCDFGVGVRGGFIMPGQKLVCRSHEFFDNPDVSQKSLAGEFLFFDGLSGFLKCQQFFRNGPTGCR